MPGPPVASCQFLRPTFDGFVSLARVDGVNTRVILSCEGRRLTPIPSSPPFPVVKLRPRRVPHPCAFSERGGFGNAQSPQLQSSALQRDRLARSLSACSCQRNPQRFHRIVNCKSGLTIIPE